MKGRSICRSKCFLNIILRVSDSLAEYVGVISYAILFVNLFAFLILPKNNLNLFEIRYGTSVFYSQNCNLAKVIKLYSFLVLLSKTSRFQ